MASSTRQENISVIQEFRSRIPADATLRTIVALIGFSFALFGCRQDAAVPKVDPNGRVEVVIPEHGAYTGAFMQPNIRPDIVRAPSCQRIEFKQSEFLVPFHESGVSAGRALVATNAGHPSGIAAEDAF